MDKPGSWGRGRNRVFKKKPGLQEGAYNGFGNGLNGLRMERRISFSLSVGAYNGFGNGLNGLGMDKPGSWGRGRNRVFKKKPGLQEGVYYGCPIRKGERIGHRTDVG